MKQIFLAGIVCLFAVAACNPSTNPSAATEEDSTGAATVAPVIKIASPACYEQKNAGDTFTLQLKITDSAGVEGTLKYGFKEKDKNAGTIAGMMYGDTLIADYHFLSEGTTSVREVAFLVTDKEAIEGYGDMEDKNGKLVFKDSHKLSFGKGVTMAKVACGN
ncbi:MAG: hypothetical protein EOP53_18770 [Sphingobacteriales bacterium]|nr:MAG: hypothetical protein EOP53_18770 [Sphingobacteriales bacterium]